MKKNPVTTGENLTQEQIENRLERAKGAGNGLLIDLCKLAREGNVSARALVAQMIRMEEPAPVFEVGQEVDVVTQLEPRQTAPARLTSIGAVLPEGQHFEAVATNGRTAYKGWVTTFFYEGVVPGRGDLCGEHQNPGSRETILHVMAERPIL